MALKREDIRSLLGRLDQASIRGFEGATNICSSRTHFDILPEHLLLRMLDEPSGDVPRICGAFGVERARVRRGLQRALEDYPTGNPGRPNLSPKLVDLVQGAAALADEYGVKQIRTGHLLLSAAINPDLMRLAEYSPELDRIDTATLRERFDEIVSTASPQEAEAGAEGAPAGAGVEGDGALAQYTIDVTARAAADEIDPVFAREHEIRQMVDILARRRKNNPILVGEPGTGKTAVVEGLALQITQGDVPPMMKGVSIRTLDMGLLQAGASVKGEFEKRLKGVIRETKASPTPIILFIDEAHTLIGAGGAAGGGDASNLLKPALARGELRTIAATTWAEYKKYFEKDAALERRFQVVKVEEPDEAGATVMLRGLQHKYASHHKVFLLDEGVRAAVHLSKRYISGRMLPDKAVDLLDTAAARVAVGATARPGELEDIDRQLWHLDTSIKAIERDAEVGVGKDEEALQVAREALERLNAERERLEAKWEKEKSAVDRVRTLRSRLLGEGNGEAAGEGDEAGGDGNGKLDEAERRKLREELQTATEELRTVQGETPLVHADVGAAVVAQVVADWTGIPIGNMLKDEMEAALKIEDRLRERVVGQDHALSLIASKVRTGMAGIRDPKQPLGVFLCVGPSGVGKTECGLGLADQLFGGERALTTINMSEFMEKHTVSQLKGSPPGYVGYGEGGVLTEAVRQHPYSVLLLDEVEKAHPDVMNLFYQVFDKGSLADGEGRVIDFSNTLIMLTSNLASDVIMGMWQENEDVSQEDLLEAIYPALRDHFKPALVARMTVIPFVPIGAEVMRMIVGMKLKKVEKRLKEAHDMQLEVLAQAVDLIASKCTAADVGARNVDHVLTQTILPQIARNLLERLSTDSMTSRLVMGADDGGAFTYNFSD